MCETVFSALWRTYCAVETVCTALLERCVIGLSNLKIST